MLISVSKSLFLSIVICIVTLSHDTAVYGDTQTQKQIDELIQLKGYTNAEKAIEIFEQQHQTIVQLPKDLPFNPTHRFGQVTNQGNLKLHLMRMFNKPHQDFVIIILAPNNKIESYLSDEDKILNLKDNSKAYLKTIDNYFNLLLFYYNGYGYLVGGNTTHIPKFNEEGLKEIAESI